MTRRELKETCGNKYLMISGSYALILLTRIADKETGDSGVSNAGE